MVLETQYEFTLNPMNQFEIGRWEIFFPPSLFYGTGGQFNLKLSSFNGSCCLNHNSWPLSIALETDYYFAKRNS